jgi:hypothetical protein
MGIRADGCPEEMLEQGQAQVLCMSAHGCVILTNDRTHPTSQAMRSRPRGMTAGPRAAWLASRWREGVRDSFGIALPGMNVARYLR